MKRERHEERLVSTLGEAGHAPGAGLRELKRLNSGKGVMGTVTYTSAAKLVLDSWSKRHSAPRLLFHASQVGLAEVIGQLLTPFMEGPCPSPIIVEYLKEALVASWASNATLVDATIVKMCASERCWPGLQFRFQATVDICRTYLWNAWCKRAPEDDTDANVPPSTASSAVIPCLQLFLRGIQHWHNLSNSNGASDVDAMTERGMEICAAALRKVLGSEMFAERLSEIVNASPAQWQELVSALSSTYHATSNAPKLKPLWDELRILSDPLQLLVSSEPTLIKDVLGAELQSDDVTRRSLMLAMWAIMDRSNHGGGDIEALGLLMFDMRALQGSRVGHFVYNTWLSALFMLHSSKGEVAERIVGRHFLLAHLPNLFQCMRRLECRCQITSCSPLTHILSSSDESLCTSGLIEQAFAKVRAWPHFLNINGNNTPSQPALATPTGTLAAAAAPPAAPPAGPQDVWQLVSEAFVEAGVMEEKQVVAHIRPMASWHNVLPAPLSAEELRNNKRPQHVQDILTLESVLLEELEAWNQSSAAAAPPPTACAIWFSLCNEVWQGSRCSVAAAKAVTRILGVPADMPPTPEPQAAFVPPATATPQQAAKLELQAEHAHAARVAAQALPTWRIRAHVYLELARLAVRQMSVLDVIQACGLLEELVLGLVYRIDILGAHSPTGATGTGADPALEQVHELFGDLFLITCQLVNRYKLHQSWAFLRNLEGASRRWAAWALRACFHVWLRRHSEMQRVGKLIIEDRDVENKLVEAIFNQNWSKKEPLQKAVINYCPWGVLECVPAFAERVFLGSCSGRMKGEAAAQALLMLISVVRYGMVDCIAHLCAQVKSLRIEASGTAEQVSAKKAVDVLQKVLEDLSKDDPSGKGGGVAPLGIVAIDCNLAFVLLQFSDTRLVQKLKTMLDLALIDLQSYKKVLYDVLVGVHRGGPQLKFSQDMRLLRSRCGPFELAQGMLNEVLSLALGHAAPSYSTMLNLASIGSFLLSHSARAPGPSCMQYMPYAPHHPQPAAASLPASNAVAESFMLRVLPSALPRLESQRQALLLARFTTMLAIFNGCSAWQPQRRRPAAAEEKGEGLRAVPPGQQALESSYGPIAQMLESLAAASCWTCADSAAAAGGGGGAKMPARDAGAGGGGSRSGGGGWQDVCGRKMNSRDLAVLTYALSLLTHALRLRWPARYVDLERAARALRSLGYYRLAWLCVDCKHALELADAQPEDEAVSALSGALDSDLSCTEPPPIL